MQTFHSGTFLGGKSQSGTQLIVHYVFSMRNNEGLMVIKESATECKFKFIIYIVNAKIFVRLLWEDLFLKALSILFSSLGSNRDC